MKCPVCAWEHPSLLCPRCGYDSSRDYGKYPTFGTVGKHSAASAQRKAWEEQQQPKESEAPSLEFQDQDFRDAFADLDLFEPEIRKMPRKKPLWIVTIVCALVVAFGIWGAMWLGGGRTGSKSSSWSYHILKADNPTSEYVYGTAIYKNSVASVTFLDTLEDVPKDAIDVSKNGNGSVMMWSTKNEAFGFNLFYAANGGINGKEACRYMFSDYTNIEHIHFNGNFHTDEVQDMRCMFNHCYGLKALDLSSFQTENVQHMGAMFYGCAALRTLDLSGFDTRNVQYMNSMFSRCYRLETLDLSHFDTQNVQYMNAMFTGCPAGEDWQHLLQ